jgi:hypothetical protein
MVASDMKWERRGSRGRKRKDREMTNSQELEYKDDLGDKLCLGERLESGCDRRLKQSN